MKCIIPGPNVKAFGKAIHSLSKIGDELYMEPQSDSLALKTVNSSRSAYSCFTFKSQFFVQYTNTITDSAPDSDHEESIRCKITMKSCLTVFKSLSSLEKTVDKCKIHLDMKEARLIFQLHCRHGIVKTHNLSFIECESLQAVFTKELLPNALTAQTRLFMDAVVNFQNNQEEISLNVNPSKVIIRNYVDDEPDPNKVIRSELSIAPEEFDNFQVGVDTEVTFCLKELRAILAFSESSNLPLSAHFENAGKPIIFSLETDTGCEGVFVLATLAESLSQATCSQRSVRVQNPNQSQRKSKQHKTSVSQTNNKQNSAKAKAISNGQNVHDINMDISAVSNVPRLQNTNLTISDNVMQPSKIKNNVQNDDDDDDDVSDKVMQPSKINNEQNDVDENSDDDDDDDDDVCSPIIPQYSNKKVLETGDVDDMVPGTPPAKKFKSVFFGLSQSTTSGSQYQEHDKPLILAEDSDDGD